MDQLGRCRRVAVVREGFGGNQWLQVYQTHLAGTESESKTL